MKKLIETSHYNHVVRKLRYPFGDFYLFENFVISEIREDVVFTWKDHAQRVVEEISAYYENNGSEVVYISNRVHAYAVVPSDWLKFFKYSYSLKGYAVVAQTKNSILESLFMSSKMRNFPRLDDAIAWANEINPIEKKIADQRSA
ncbi:MAG: hypothetical protein AAGL34_08975 [Bacteroidota bacterium]